MKTLRQVQYCAIAIITVVFLEGMLTLGSAFNFQGYNWFGWFMQAVVFAFAITTALRVEHETSKEGQ
jgi:predicted outer membrane lipoprotein